MAKQLYFHRKIPKEFAYSIDKVKKQPDRADFKFYGLRRTKWRAVRRSYDELIYSGSPPRKEDSDADRKKPGELS